MTNIHMHRCYEVVSINWYIFIGLINIALMKIAPMIWMRAVTMTNIHMHRCDEVVWIYWYIFIGVMNIAPMMWMRHVTSTNIHTHRCYESNQAICAWALVRFDLFSLFCRCFPWMRVHNSHFEYITRTWTWTDIHACYWLKCHLCAIYTNVLTHS